MAKWFAFSFLMIISLGTISCKKNGEQVNYQATPYTLPQLSSLPIYPLPQNNPLTVEGISLGRKLFYDPILSKDSTISCASCHNLSHAFTDNGKKFSEGVNGRIGNRNSMPIFNLMWAESFFWDGRAPSLHHQALMPIEDTNEMAETLENVLNKLGKSSMYLEDFKKAFGTDVITTERLGLAIEQFMVTVVSGNSKFDRFMMGQETLTPEEQRGFALFNGISDSAKGTKGAECFHCHGTSLFTINQFANNGLDSVFADPGLAAITGNQNDMGKFKVPSLRNVAVSGPYMHDGRFQTLLEVVEFYNSQVKHSSTIDPNMHAMQSGLKLNQQEISDLIAYLNTLTDDEFLVNPDYQNPF